VSFTKYCKKKIIRSFFLKFGFEYDQYLIVRSLELGQFLTLKRPVLLIVTVRSFRVFHFHSCRACTLSEKKARKFRCTGQYAASTNIRKP